MPLLTKHDIAAEIAKGRVPTFVYFWDCACKTPDAPGPHWLCQWFESPFEIDGQLYGTAEHFMMAEKARLFGDHATRELILNIDHPHMAKQLGRTVAGFDDATWTKHRIDIVRSGSMAKFRQNPRLLDYLTSTGNAVLVEASPVDPIWGIGLFDTHPNAKHPELWPGDNLLGFVLMQVREALQA